MRIFIEPNDVLMFRDGKPFAGGEDHFARGTFPPPPSTVYGALRSHILSVKSGEFQTFKDEPSKISKNLIDEIGTKDTLGKLEIKQFVVAKNDGGQIRRYFPMPRDIAKTKGKDNGSYYILKPIGDINNIIQTDLPIGLYHMWHETEEALEAAAGFLAENEMARYLLGNPPQGVIDIKSIYEIEERTGIRKSRALRSVETGGLYSVEYFRMKEGIGFFLELGETILMPQSGIIRLGGDHRSARYNTCACKSIDVEPIKDKIARDKKFKIVILTPAILKKGWVPESIDSKTFEGLINGVKVKMLSACVGKPVGIGGFDMANSMPKTMKKSVPSGSVYYFELKDSADNLFEKVWLKSISDERNKEGFGITLIGGL